VPNKPPTMSLCLETFMAQLLTEHNGSLPILQDNSRMTSYQTREVQRKRRKPAKQISLTDCSMDAPRLPSRSTDSPRLLFDCGHNISRQPRSALESTIRPAPIWTSSADRLSVKSWENKSPGNVHRVSRWACAV
jgi:hypothetical protein